MEKKRALCYMCWQQCGLKVELDDNGKVIGCEGDPKSILGGGYTCERVAAIPEFHYSEERLNYPLKRTGERGEDKWERITWDQAMDEIADKLKEIKKDYGPEAVGRIGGTIHGPADWACWRFFNLWGSPNPFNQGKNCGSSNVLIEVAMYGWDAIASVPVPGVTKTAVCWGDNYAQSYQQKWNQFLAAQQQGCKIIVIDPRYTESASHADLWLKVRPGTDGALAWGMLRVLIEEDLYDHEFVENWCTGFERVKDRAMEYDLNWVAWTTGVQVEKIVMAAHWISESPSCITSGLASCHSGTAGQVASHGQALLRAITGNIDRYGGNSQVGPNTSVKWYEGIAWDAIVDNPDRTKDSLTAKQYPICSIDSLKRYNDAVKKAWGYGYNCSHYMIFSSPRGYWDAIRYDDPYPMKALFIQCGNPLLTLSGAKECYDALKKVELLVGMDFFMTPSMAMCDYVLPAADFLERPHLSLFWGIGTVSVAHRQVSETLYDRRDDYYLWKELGVRVGQEWPENLEKMYDFFLEPTGMTMNELADREENWTIPTHESESYRKTGFGTPSGKCELVPSLFEVAGLNPLPYYEEPSQSPIKTPEVAEKYPFMLISGSRIMPYFHTMHREMRTLRWRHPEPVVEIHPETARKLGIANGDMTYIETEWGRVRQKARVTSEISPDVVHAEAYWYYPEQPHEEPYLLGVWDSNINAIIPDDYEYCDYSGDQPLRAMMCNIYKADTALNHTGPFAVDTTMTD